MGTCGTEDVLVYDKSDRPGAHTIEPCARPAYQTNSCASTGRCRYPFRSTSVALLHEAHSSLDACAGCGRGQWSGGAQPSLSSSTAAADALEAVVRADLVMLFTCLVVVDWQVDHPPAHCMNMLK